MDLNKVCVGMIFLVALLGISFTTSETNNVYGADIWSGSGGDLWSGSGEISGEQWVSGSRSNVGMTGLTATIHLRIKNNNKHVQYFKISQIYNSNNQLSDNIYWTVLWTEPDAVRMIKSNSPTYLGGEWGWKIQPGQTKEVTFKVAANGIFGVYPAYITNNNTVDNMYWPIIPEPGIYASWFFPNEIEMLNPALDLQYWKGTFHFHLRDYDPQGQSLSGIVRGPIIPVDSKLVSVSPSWNYFKDKDLYLGTDTVAWDVRIHPGCNQQYYYTYVWPASSSSSSSVSSYSSPSSVPKTSAAKTTPSVPTKDTGVPYGLFVIGGIIAAGSVIYARYLR